MYENTEFTLKRDCEAIQIPSGQKTTIPAGTQGVITQSLGGSYTIATYQGLARVAENDLEALGLVYDCRLNKKEDGGTRVEVKMTLTAPGCGMGPAIAHDAQSKILSIDGIDEAQVDLVWDPPWNQNMISEAGRMKLGMI